MFEIITCVQVPSGGAVKALSQIPSEHIVIDGIPSSKNYYQWLWEQRDLQHTPLEVFAHVPKLPVH